MPADDTKNIDIEYLKNRKKLLLELIKSKHTEFYAWMIENGVDPTDLKSYAVAIASALVIALASNNTPNTSLTTQKVTRAELIPQVRILEKEELLNKTELERGELVLERYGHIIDRVAEKYKLDPKLIFATIMIESGGNTYAIRYEPHINDSSYGLGQILYRTAKWIGFDGKATDLYDPEVNIELIGRYYAKNRAMFGEDLTNKQLVTAYNAGNPFSHPTAGHIQKFEKWFNRSIAMVN